MDINWRGRVLTGPVQPGNFSSFERDPILPGSPQTQMPGDLLTSAPQWAQEAGIREGLQARGALSDVSSVWDDALAGVW